MNPLQLFLSVAALGGRLEIIGDNLKTILPRDCPQEFKDAIRQQKVSLLELLRLNFLVVRSNTLNSITFWTPDEETKPILIKAGADPGVIYTATELERIVNYRITANELPLLHLAKQRFSGRILSRTDLSHFSIHE